MTLPYKKNPVQFLTREQYFFYPLELIFDRLPFFILKSWLFILKCF